MSDIFVNYFLMNAMQCEVWFVDKEDLSTPINFFRKEKNCWRLISIKLLTLRWDNEVWKMRMYY